MFGPEKYRSLLLASILCVLTGLSTSARSGDTSPTTIQVFYLATRPIRDVSTFTPQQIQKLLPALRPSIPADANIEKSLANELKSTNGVLSSDLFGRLLNTASNTSSPQMLALLAVAAAKAPFNDADIAIACYLAPSCESVQQMADRDQLPKLVPQLIAVGYEDIAAQLLIAKSHRDEDDIQNLIVCLTQMGKFSSASKLYFAAHDTLKHLRSQTVLFTAFSAFEMCDANALDRIVANDAAILRGAQAIRAITAARDVIHGLTVKDDEFLYELHDTQDPDAHRVITWLIAESDLNPRNQRPRYLQDIFNLACEDPNNRINWIVLDGYLHRWPIDVASDLYCTAQFLRPDASDVHAMVKEWREFGLAFSSAVPDPTIPEQATVIQQSKTERWPIKRPSSDQLLMRFSEAIPFHIVARLSVLAGQKKFTEARDLALRYHDLAIQNGTPRLQLFTNHLIARLDQIEHPTASTSTALVTTP